MLPRPSEKIPTKDEAMLFMAKYLMLINIPFKMEYEEWDLKYIRIRKYEHYDEDVIKDIKGLCTQLGGYFSCGEEGQIYPYLDLEWS